MIHDGFAECMRVLKPNGVLIFKWSEFDIPAEKVWKAIDQKPLFGHHSGKQSKTFWGTFMKLQYDGFLYRTCKATKKFYVVLKDVGYMSPILEMFGN